MPSTKRALQTYLLRAFLFFLVGGLISAVLLHFFPLQTRRDDVLALLLGSLGPGGLYVIARYIDKQVEARAMQPPVRRLFDIESYGMLLLISPLVFLLAMGKGLLRLRRLTRPADPYHKED